MTFDWRFALSVSSSVSSLAVVERVSCSRAYGRHNVLEAVSRDRSLVEIFVVLVTAQYDRNQASCCPCPQCGAASTRGPLLVIRASHVHAPQNCISMVLIQRDDRCERSNGRCENLKASVPENQALFTIFYTFRPQIKYAAGAEVTRLMDQGGRNAPDWLGASRP
jgi:hypothetical protein